MQKSHKILNIETIAALLQHQQHKKNRFQQRIIAIRTSVFKKHRKTVEHR